MSKQLPNQQLAAQPATPHPANPQPNAGKPSQLALLAEKVAKVQASLNSSPAAVRTARRGSFPRRRVASPRATLKPEGRPVIDRHRRKCIICQHPEREAIEELFLHWHNPEWITRLFDLDNCMPIYRHAYATGLYARRRGNLRMSLEHLIEQADAAEPTGAVIVRAVRAYACLTDSGEWREPVTRVEFSSQSSPSAPPPSVPEPLGLPAPQSSAPSDGLELPCSGISNRKQKLLESSVSDSKQTPEVVSNR